MMKRRSTSAGCSMSSCSLQLLLLALLLLLLLFASGTTTASGAPWNSPRARAVSSLKMARIQRRLDRINKPPVRSIQCLDGDTIDCIPRHKQPALDHPLLTNHKIQKVPSMIPTLKGGPPAVNYSAAHGGRKAWQTWHHVGHCPKGTVPIRRTSAADVLRAKSVFHYGRKQVSAVLSPARPSDAPDVVSGNGHEHAIAYTGGSSPMYGAKATVNVWDPSIQESNGFSLSQLWILSGSFDGSDLNSIEAGWQVSPELYGDSKPRLFTYWTSDAYQATGCYNALCPGFVQTSDKIAIGASISPVSSFGGSQYDITILIWKDPKLGNWWLSYGDSDNLVGYWPAELFTHLSDHATMVEWGGEVVNTRPDGAHTSTQMGSGRFAGDGFGRASYFRNLETVDADNSLSAVPFDAVQTLAEETSCYDIQKLYNDNWGTHFYYGGPGHNPSCP